MSRDLSASDRSALIRLASTLEQGSPTRRAILASLPSAWRVGQRIRVVEEGYFQPLKTRYMEWLDKGVTGVIVKETEDNKGEVFHVSVKHTPSGYADDPAAYDTLYVLEPEDLRHWKPI